MKRILIILACCLGILFADQKLADKPLEKAISIITHDGGLYCYAPTFTKGEGYIYIDNCKSSTPKLARYDVFQRIAYLINEVWLCLTAPSSVTGSEGQATEKWDYIVLRPCTLNNPDQRWIIKNNAIYTADGRFRVQDYKWYAVLAKDNGSVYKHSLTSNMGPWINTIAQPGNISLQTFVGWVFVSPYSWSLYYFKDQISSKEREYMYYNPENGHIAQYNPSDGSLSCMYSKQTGSQNWNWVGWGRCTDKIPNQKDSAYWEFFLMNDNDGMLKDYKGNFLKVTSYGPNWGTPYTSKPKYYDSTNNPIFNFIFSHDMSNWQRYINANIADNLQYCPAPGHKGIDSSNKSASVDNAVQDNSIENKVTVIEKPLLRSAATNSQKTIRSLPPSFKLNADWIRRFWQTAATSASGPGSFIGVCGICLLQAYQMVAELQEYAISGTPTGRGYFFDIAPHTNPFDSLRTRFPLMEQRLIDAEAFFGLPYQEGEDASTRTRRVLYSTTISVLPQYSWDISQVATNNREINSLIRDLFSAPTGTLWIYFIMRTNRDGTGVAGHAQPILRTDEGIVIIPTNTPSFTFDLYANYMIPYTSPHQVLEYLSFGGTRTIYQFTLARVSHRYENPLETMFSVNNCDGAGPHRRGNAHNPLSSLVNQCSGGRCAIQ